MEWCIDSDLYEMDQRRRGRATSIIFMQAWSLVPLPLAMAGEEAGDSRLAAD